MNDESGGGGGGGVTRVFAFCRTLGGGREGGGEELGIGSWESQQDLFKGN